MANQGEVDELFDIRNAFYIGNYQQCINEAQRIKLSSSDLKVERDSYLYKAYLAQNKFRVLIDEINLSSPTELQPLKVLATYLSSTLGSRESIVAKLDQQCLENSENHNNFISSAATIYDIEENYEAALKILNEADSLECLAIKLQIYLRMNRVDLALKELKQMQEKDDDATLTQLAQAWVNIAMGGDKLQEAYYIFQEMCDKYIATPLLLNGQAVCFIAQGKFEEAESALQDAIDKDSNYPETLINMTGVLNSMNKSEEVHNRYLTQLKDSHPYHPYVKDILKMESEFDRLSLKYKPND